MRALAKLNVPIRGLLILALATTPGCVTYDQGTDNFASTGSTNTGGSTGGSGNTGGGNSSSGTNGGGTTPTARISNGVMTGVNGWDVAATIDVQPNSGPYGTPVSIVVTFTRGASLVSGIDIEEYGREGCALLDTISQAMYKLGPTRWSLPDGWVLYGTSGVIRFIALNGQNQRIAFGDITINDGCAGGASGGASMSPVTVDFRQPTAVTLDCTASYSGGVQYNDTNGGNWRLVSPGGSSITVSFTLASVPANARLKLVHLTSSSSGCPGNGYSPVDLRINGSLFKDNYDVASNHSGSHGFETDSWPVTSFLRTGSNTITIELEDNPWACTHYWIQSLEVSLN